MSAGRVVVFPSQGEGESPADRIRRLQSEAKSLAREHIELLAQTLSEASRLAAEIGEGGESYPVGARELARRIGEDSNKQALTLTAIVERH